MTDTQLQGLNALSGITSLDQLRLSRGGQLERRGRIGTACHKIADGWRSRTQEGRTGVAVRASAVLAALDRAVQQAEASGTAQGEDIRTRLAAVRDCVSGAAEAKKQALFRELRSGVEASPSYAALPSSMRAALDEALARVSALPASLWNARLNGTARLFYACADHAPALADAVLGFGDKLATDFLAMAEQARIGDDGIHPSLFGCPPIHGLGGEGVQPHDPAQALKALLHDHAELLPFISMAAARCASSAAESMAQFSALPADALRDAGLQPQDAPPRVSIRREGRNLTICAEQVRGFALVGDGGTQPGGLRHSRCVTMQLVLDERPRRMEMFGSAIVLPQFTMGASSQLLCDEEGAPRQPA